jgi:RHS repeat-associated protein
MDFNTGLTQVLTDGTNTYTYGLGRLSQQSGSTAEYFLGDALGSVRQLTDQYGELAYAQSYDPYGAVRDTTQLIPDTSSAYGYTGEQQSGDMVYLRARYYNPADGRFMSRDTWGGDANRPMSMNRWMYVEGNPINRTDPSGYWYCTGTINCETWVEKTLENLRKLDSQIVSDFERYDNNLIALHKSFKFLTTGIDPLNPPNWDECSFTDVGFRFTFTNLNTFAAITRPTHIDIDTNYSNSYKPTTVALFGHELYHLLRQSFFVATTIYGELLAAQYEAYLVQLQGVALPSKLQPPGYGLKNGVLNMNPNYGPDLVAYRNFTPYPWYEPLYPLGVVVIWPTQNAPECMEVSSGQPLACKAPTAPLPTEPASTTQP